jgi:hypothetical protein
VHARYVGRGAQCLLDFVGAACAVQPIQFERYGLLAVLPVRAVRVGRAVDVMRAVPAMSRMRICHCVTSLFWG